MPVTEYVPRPPLSLALMCLSIIQRQAATRGDEIAFAVVDDAGKPVLRFDSEHVSSDSALTAAVSALASGEAIGRGAACGGPFPVSESSGVRVGGAFGVSSSIAGAESFVDAVLRGLADARVRFENQR
jgi:hypothetical protein